MSASKLEILSCESTRLGLLCLRRRELLSRPGTIVTEITLNHEFLMSSYVNVSERALARCALDMHPGRELSVLIGGLGLGYTAHEVLAVGADRVARVEVVEYLPQVIEWMEQDLVPLARDLKADSRLAVVEDDVYDRLWGAPERRYDLILIDVDHSPAERLGSANASFYTLAGLKRARRHLADAGIFAVWSYAQHSPFVSEVRVQPVTVMNDLVDEEQTDWLFFARR
jgi:spermidine synthase